MRAPTPPPAEAERTIDDVQREDAVFRADAAEAPPLDPTTEGAALKAMLRDATTCARCSAVVTADRWDGTCEVRARCEGLSDQELGERVAGVIEALDAPHLRPTGIAERLRGGVDAACHGIATLLANIKEGEKRRGAS